MNEITIAFHGANDIGINEAKEFCDICSKYPFEIDLCSNRYVVNAKSIMGLLSLDLLKPIQLKVRTDDPGDFFEKIDRFIVK